MEVKVGEYVRTKDGVIAKLEDIQEQDNAYWFDRIIYSRYDDVIDFLTREELSKYIVKHSKNIIDLIEVGDYVNGERIIHISKLSVWSKKDVISKKDIKSISRIEVFRLDE